MSEAAVIKKIIYAGKTFIPIENGSKVYFHFQTWKLGTEKVLLDDSKKMGKNEPMVLVIGHKFKLEVWETIVKKMAVGEVASFIVKEKLVFSYPFVSKTLRELGMEKNEIKHSCSATLHSEGIGYPDLDELIRKPSDLEFIIELLKVERSDEYEKDLWQLNTKERIDFIPKLREKGNNLYKKKEYDAAEEAYREALSICEQLLVRERKGDEEWAELNKIKLPILLNYAQCKLVKGEYYQVIEHCNTVLEYEPENEKALFRRAKAHISAWNPIKAEQDLKQLKFLNPSLANTVDHELDKISKLRKQKEIKDKEAMKKLFTANNGSTDNNS